eukprot:5567709-Amphidinium_carterae.1
MRLESMHWVERTLGTNTTHTTHMRWDTRCCCNCYIPSLGVGVETLLPSLLHQPIASEPYGR